MIALLESPSLQTALVADLNYVRDDGPGIHRKRTAKAFRYIDAAGLPIRDLATLARIKALGIPPAWTDVWICADADGHIQATGRDAKGRKQYRYHTRWREARSANKFERMLIFGQTLPRIRERVAQDPALAGLPRQKVLALVVRLLELTFIRVGNEEYARANKSFGLTTLRDKHVTVSGAQVQFTFRGKSGKDHTISLRDRRLAGLIRRCKDIPGSELFQYVDENKQHQTITSTDVNSYLREISGQPFSAKDFRTWGGTVLAVRAFNQMGVSDSEAHAKKNVAQAVKEVSQQLGNTPAICTKYYMHPAVIDAYQRGTLHATLAASLEADGLSAEENVVLTVLSACAEPEQGSAMLENRNSS